MSSGIDTTNMTKEELIGVLHTLQNRITELESRESAYQEQKQLFETLLSSAPIGLYIVQDGRFAVFGAEFLRITGHSEKDIIGNHSLSLVVTEDRDRVRENAIMMLKGARITGYEFKITTRSGEIRNISEIVTSIQYQGKRAVLSNFMDITGYVRALQALKASEHNFHNSVETSTLGIRIIDVEGNSIYANQALLNLWGYNSIDELKATPQEKLYTSDSYRKQLERRHKRKIGRPVSSPYEISIVRKDGEVRHVRAFRNEILWEGRTCLQFIHQDITDRILAEEKHRTILQTALDGFCITSREGRLLEVNDSYCDIIGYSREELLERSVTDIEAVEDPDETHRHLEEIARNGSDRFETKHRRKDGQVIDVEVSVNYIDIDGGQLFIFLRDITERKRAEEEIKKLNHAIEQSDDGIVIYNLNNMITYANRAYSRMHGFPHQEIIGMSLAKVHRDEDFTRLALRKTKDGLTQKEREHFRADSTSFPVYTSVTVLTNSDGVPVGTLAIDRDITDRKQAEEEIRKLNQAIEQSTDGIAIYNTENKLIYANKMYALMHGHSPKEIIGLNVKQVHRDENFYIPVPISNMKKDSQVQIEREHFKEDGTVFYVNTSVTMLANNEGMPIGTLAIDRDITESKRAEEEINKLNRAIEQSNDGIAIYDLDTRLTYANGAYARMHGYSPEEIIGMSVTEIHRDDDSPIAVDILKNESPMHIERMHFREDRTSFPVSTSLALLTNNEGIPIGTLTIDRDITELKRTEEALQKSEGTLRAIGESMPDVTIILDDEGRYIDILTGEKDRLYRKKEDVIGKRLHDILPGEIADDGLEAIREAINRNETQTIEYQLNVPAGERWFEGRVSPIQSTDYQKKLVVMVSRDITERKLLEDELRRVEKLESIGTLAGGIAHDFNNLLTAIMGNISLAIRHAEHGKDVTDRLLEAEKASQRARDLTRQLLTFSRGGEPVKKSVHIAELLRESANFALRGSNVRCAFTISDDLWLVDIDESQISQVITNLVINGDEAMPEGGTINITARNIVVGEKSVLPFKKGKYVETTIQDQGIGIKKNHLNRIFEPYFTTKQKGSGLGLATAYSIIKQHHGYRKAESCPAAGTVFHIYLPISRKQEQVNKQAKPRTRILGRGQVLVMDDEEAIRELLQVELTESGYKVELAENGETAINMFEEARRSGQPFHAVILDLTVPGGLGGKETMKKLLEIDPDTRAIVSSGFSNDPVIAKHEKYGFSAVVSKPYNLAELEQTLCKLLNLESK